MYLAKIIQILSLFLLKISYISACRSAMPTFESSDDEACEIFACDNNSPYRTFDGSCNNLKRPSWGTPNTTYGTLFEDSFSDDKDGFPVSSSNEPLPNARTVSMELFPIAEIDDPEWPILLMTWGQTMAHDIARAADGAPPGRCCSNGKFTVFEVSDPRCKSIHIPPNDEINVAAGNECYDFYRTPTNGDRCDSEKRYQPLNVVSAFMDASLTYGSDNPHARDIREFDGGRLLSANRNDQEWMPQSHDVIATCGNPANQPCYRAGDNRVNQNAQLSMLQTIFLREHNRIADYLSSLNSHWDDEKCYQEARKILIATIQCINYNEYLPILIGLNNAVESKLTYPGHVGYVEDYDEDLNPSMCKEFATAAFRNLHSTIKGSMQFYTESRILTNSTKISDHINKPAVIERGQNFNQLTRGFCTQPQNYVGIYYTDEIKNFLFKGNRRLGIDLRAFDIQRSRDHGLAKYPVALRRCGLLDAKSFDDYLKYIPLKLVLLLKKVYKSYEDVDLVVGGALETRMPGTMSGPVFRCIYTEQFRRTRCGDRHFFENRIFTLDQLNSIRKGATAATLMCNNAAVELMQPQAFLRTSPINTLVSCKQMPQVDLSLWKENV